MLCLRAAAARCLRVIRYISLTAKRWLNQRLEVMGLVLSAAVTMYVAGAHEVRHFLAALW